jgi:hypothetical protein
VLLRTRKGEQGAPEQAAGNAGPPLWLQLAHAEIELRTRGTGCRHDLLDQMLQMESRLTSQYPDMPYELKTEFNVRLHARGYSDEAWDAAVLWLASTDWFRLRGRYLEMCDSVGLPVRDAPMRKPSSRRSLPGSGASRSPDRPQP